MTHDALNPHVLNDLFGDDHEVIREILEAYAADLTLRASDLRAAANERDRTRVSRIAHSLKGASANVGADDFASFCATIEQLATSAPWPSIDDACAQVSDDAVALCARVQARLAAL